MLDLPIAGTSLLNSYWGIWLPAGASAFNVILVKRFMENLPIEIIEAARVDGAGPIRLLLSIVLPMSKPVIGVVSVFAVLITWKDYLWPLVVLPDSEIQPLSVRLPLVRDTLQLDVFLAALAISMVLPIALFIVFRRFFISGEAMSGAIKGTRCERRASAGAPHGLRGRGTRSRRSRDDARRCGRRATTTTAPPTATPKQAHGGCCPRARWHDDPHREAITSTPTATAAGHGSASPVTTAAPTTELEPRQGDGDRSRDAEARRLIDPPRAGGDLGTPATTSSDADDEASESRSSASRATALRPR